MKTLPPCATCKFWSPDDERSTSGWCHLHLILADSSDWCDAHKPVIISKSTTMTRISETVQAAIYFTKSTGYNQLDFCWASEKIEREITEADRTRGCSQLAAAARILAAEVERLWKELNKN